MPATAAAVGPISVPPSDTAAVAASFRAAVAGRQAFDVPYRHWLVENIFPAGVAAELAGLPFAVPQLGGISGKRELHNDQRSYFDAAAMARFPVMRAVAEALQSGEIVRLIHDAFEAPIDDTFLRLEYAQDCDGFWLEPHSDLGVKKFTCLIYLSDGPGHETLGTDIYWSKERHFGRSPFKQGAAMIFVPAANTWHGFEKRRIEGVRRSVILNYVTHEWRAREQLSFPEQPVRV
ncbi:MAG: 2OG-Fe(II) oxygenase [Methylobacteriaceae bacterium]|nr:2OG-Fe(II) oxygenase [Methylobacteriaceae bacterium]MBV9217776.1 2OG-Fe(II) oxygenase [Methylobacteriaceae bacterium]MBV9243934.1 2OG-Fe(II) oxygenase [Methylobacteriaceae bacterium]MBV9705103.1 2OG-Fe(II) oxygenase [Methylobacteriaceae bacterium]